VTFVIINTLNTIGGFTDICLCCTILILTQQNVECRTRTLFQLTHHVEFRLWEHYHLANLIADEHRADAVWIASTQMRRYDFTSCHKT
jgi:hypothetical protein